MFSQLLYLLCTVIYVFAAPLANVVPLEYQPPTVIPIVSQSEEYDPSGTYRFSYETGNGIKREETAYDKELPPKPVGRSASSNEGGEDSSDESDEIHVQQGSYSYTAPDGTLITVRYIADENGFRPIIVQHSKKSGKTEVIADYSEKRDHHLKVTDNEEVESAPAQTVSKSLTTATVPAIASRNAGTLEKESAFVKPTSTSTHIPLPLTTNPVQATLASLTSGVTDQTTLQINPDSTTSPQPGIGIQSSTSTGTPLRQSLPTTSELSKDMSKPSESSNYSSTEVPKETTMTIVETTSSPNSALETSTVEENQSPTTVKTTASVSNEKTLFSTDKPQTASEPILTTTQSLVSTPSNSENLSTDISTASSEPISTISPKESVTVPEQASTETDQITDITTTTSESQLTSEPVSTQPTMTTELETNSASTVIPSTEPSTSTSKPLTSEGASTKFPLKTTSDDDTTKASPTAESSTTEMSPTTMSTDSTTEAESTIEPKTSTTESITTTVQESSTPETGSTQSSNYSTSSMHDEASTTEGVSKTTDNQPLTEVTNVTEITNASTPSETSEPSSTSHEVPTTVAATSSP